MLELIIMIFNCKIVFFEIDILVVGDVCNVGVIIYDCLDCVLYMFWLYFNFLNVGLFFVYKKFI